MSNCLNCSGLITEPGVAYGYAGKICHCPKDPAHVYQRPDYKEALTRYTHVAIHQHAETLAKLAQADEVIKELEIVIKRQMHSDELCEHPFNEDMAEALAKLKSYREKQK